MNTISSELQTIRAEAEKLYFGSLGVPDLPTAIPETVKVLLSRMIKECWEGARTAARAELEGQREGLAQAHAVCEQDKARWAQREAHWEMRFENLEDERDALKQQLATLNEAKRKGEGELAATHARFKDLTERYSSLEVKLKNSQAERLAIETAERASREKLKARYAGFEQVMTERVNASDSRAQRAETALKQAEKAKQTMQQTIERLRQARDAAKGEVKTLTTAAKEAEKELQRLRKQPAQNETVLTELQTALSGLRMEMERVREARAQAPARKKHHTERKPTAAAMSD